MTQDPGTWGRLGDALRADRERQGITQAQLASSAGVSIGAVQDAESGRVPRKRMPYTITRIANILGWPPGTVEHILQGGDIPTGVWVQRPAAPDPGDVAAEIISGAMVRATDHATAAEIREAARIAVEEMRRRGVLPPMQHADGKESDRNAS